MTSRITSVLASTTTLALLLSVAHAGASSAGESGSVSVDRIQYRGPGSGLDERYAPGGPAYYYVNRYGYGNYVRGRDGSYGGYPAGSAGARELEINQELKCRYTPESC